MSLSLFNNKLDKTYKLQLYIKLVNNLLKEIKIVNSSNS